MNDCESGPAKSVSLVTRDALSLSCSCSGSEVNSSGSAFDLGKPMSPVSKPSSVHVASVSSGESGRVASHSVHSGESGLVDSRSSSSSRSSASTNGNLLDAELSSEFNPKVPRHLIGLVIVVSKVLGSKFQYISCWLSQQQVDRSKVPGADKLNSKSA